jgi:protocatechuate 3,4-dioxygenase beta subunit
MQKPNLSTLRELIRTSRGAALAPRISGSEPRELPRRADEAAPPRPAPTRRAFLRAALGATALTVTGLASPVRAGTLTPTEPNAEGPFFRAGAPFRHQLYPDEEPGFWLLTGGYVLSTNGTPLEGVLMDVWQANNNGEYDNTTPDFLGRGRHLTDADGLWWNWTVWPGYYPGRPWHIHIKASLQGYRPLTSQLYIMGDPRTQTDGLFRPSLAMDWGFYDEGFFWAYYHIVLAGA